MKYLERGYAELDESASISKRGEVEEEVSGIHRMPAA